MIGDNDFWRRKFIGADLGSSWIPVLIVFLGFWGVGMLGLKVLASQRAGRALRLVRRVVAAEEPTVTGSAAERTLNQLARLPAWVRSYPAYARTQIALRGASRSRDFDEIADEVLNRSALEANVMETSFIPVGAFLWAIPILGFLGTTVGLSQAVASFAGALDPRSNFEQLIGELSKVTPSLAFAFDTTMVALGVVMLLYFATSWVRKQEESALAQLDDYCLVELLPRVGGQQSAARRALDLRVQVEHLRSAVSEQAEVQARLAVSLRELRDALDGTGSPPSEPVRRDRGRPEE